MKVDRTGAVVKAKKDCQGEGCPVSYCQMRNLGSENKRLGYRETMNSLGGKCRLWRCEYVEL